MHREMNCRFLSNRTENMIAFIMFLLFRNQTEFHLVQYQKEYIKYSHISFDLKINLFVFIDSTVEKTTAITIQDHAITNQQNDRTFMRALSTLRGLRGAPEVPPLRRETQSLGQQMLNAPIGINGFNTSKILTRANFQRTAKSIFPFILNQMQ